VETMPPDKKSRPATNRAAASSSRRAANSSPRLPQPDPDPAPYPSEVDAALTAAVAALRATADHVNDDAAALVARRLAADIEVVSPILFRRLVEAAVEHATSSADS